MTLWLRLKKDSISDINVTEAGLYPMEKRPPIGQYLPNGDI
jgi:hypothetical protein